MLAPSPYPSLVIQELKRHRVLQSEELLRLGTKSTDDTFVVTREDGKPLQPNSLTHEFVRLLGKNLCCHAFGFTIFAIPTQPNFSQALCIRKSLKKGWVIQILAVTSRPRRLTWPFALP